MKVLIVHGTPGLELNGLTGVLLIKIQETGKVIPGGSRDPVLERKAGGR